LAATATVTTSNTTSIKRRACGTRAGTASQRAAAQRQFQQRLRRYRTSSGHVTTASAPLIQVYLHVLTWNGEGLISQVSFLQQAAAAGLTFLLD
jgi:hypothetical protein